MSAQAALAQENKHSSMLMGPIGLNTVPSARMDKAGTVRVGAGYIDPYLHTFAGFQLSDSFYVGLRQSAEKDAPLEKSERLYPGVDFKVRLNEEGRYDPEVALGMMSAFGHKKTASEYIALSKRYKDFDFTLGMGWGRLAGDGQLSNPFKRLSSHFGNERDFNNEIPNTVHDWFTGKDVGLFAGVEYQTPVEGLSIKADWGANPYTIEKEAIAGYDAPAQWSLGVNYKPAPWVDGMIGIVGTDTVMARLSLQSNAMDWLVRPHKNYPAQELRERGDAAAPEGAEREAMKNGIRLIDTKVEGSVASAYLSLNANRPLAYQVGRAARHIANNAGKNAETIIITPIRGKIRGRPISFQRRDLEQALKYHQGSPEEVWSNTGFEQVIEGGPKEMPDKFTRGLNLALKTDVSLSEDNAEYLYRTSLVARERQQLPYGFFAGTDVKLNISDNLEKLGDERFSLADPVRSNVADYAQQRVYMERAYSGWRGMLLDDVFVSLSAGMIEEMYAGFGGEILYRPFGKTFAIGADAWHVYKRDPDDPFGKTPMNDPRVTGHLNLFYEIPETDMTAFIKAGQYLGNDRGVTLGLDHQFQNGVTLGGFVTASREADLDEFGGTTNLYSGVQLKVPLGNIPHVPEGSESITTFHPQGRDAGQLLDNPEPLYSVTEPVSYRAASRSWGRLLD